MSRPSHHAADGDHLPAHPAVAQSQRLPPGLGVRAQHGAERPLAHGMADRGRAARAGLAGAGQGLRSSPSAPNPIDADLPRPQEWQPPSQRRTVWLPSYRLSDAFDIDLEEPSWFTLHEPVTSVYQHRLLTGKRKQINGPTDRGPAILAVFLVQPDCDIRFHVSNEDWCDPDGIRSYLVELLAQVSGIETAREQTGLLLHLA
jgi:hypothetical protein